MQAIHAAFIFPRELHPPYNTRPPVQHLFINRSQTYSIATNSIGIYLAFLLLDMDKWISCFYDAA